MAKITKMPGQEIIDGFKGTLDFYVYMGINCVRSWPCSPGHDRAPAVQAQWPAFAFSGNYWKHLSSTVKSSFTQMVTTQPLTGRDLFTKSFIKGDAVRLV